MNLTDPVTQAQLAELRRILTNLGALPPTNGLHGPYEEAQHVAEHLALVSLPAHKAFLWRLHMLFRKESRYAALVRTVEHLEAYELVYEGQIRHLIGLLTLARTAPKEGDNEP